MNRRKRLALVGAVIALSLAAPAPASAHDPSQDRLFPTEKTHFDCRDNNGASYPGNGFCLQDTLAVSVYVEGLGPRMELATRRTLNNSYASSSLPFTIQYTTSPVYAASGTGETDIIYQTLHGRMPIDVLGHAQCEDKYNQFRCDQHYAQYNGDALAGRDDVTLWSIACHETGHSFGITHGSQSSPANLGNDHADFRCMRSPTSPPTNNSYQPTDQWLGQENVDALNFNY